MVTTLAGVAVAAFSWEKAARPAIATAPPSPAAPINTPRRDTALRRVKVIASPPLACCADTILARVMRRGNRMLSGAMRRGDVPLPISPIATGLCCMLKFADRAGITARAEGKTMTYDLLIRHGRIVDGSGMPAYRGDIAVKDGKIVEIGKIDGAATRTVDADGLAVSPGFIDNHCHYDAQVTWDPLCTFSPQHGATTVIFGNCSLSLAPVRRGKEERMAEFLSYVEAIPMEVLKTVDVNWETFPQYMDRLDKNLGVNAGTLIGHTAVRYYVMGDECQKGAATDTEIKEMQAIVRDGMENGALGLSVSRNQGHYDPQGAHIPAIWADEKEIFAIADVLRELGIGIIQSGGGRDAEMKNGLMARLSEATGRPVDYNSLGQSVRRPGAWQKHMGRVNETAAQGIRAYPLCSPNTTTTFNMKNTQASRGSPTWHPILLKS